MAEERENERAKRTPQEFAFDFNSGAAYASETGNLLEGMDYVFHQSRDLSSEPIIQRVMVGAKMYQMMQNIYGDKVNKWEQSEDENKGDKPKFEVGPEMALVKNHYEELLNSSRMRTQIFNEAYDALTVNQAKDSTLYGEVSKNLPKEITDLIAKHKGKTVGEIGKDNKLRNALDAFKKYHVLGNTAQNIQGMYLKKTLENLAQSE